MEHSDLVCVKRVKGKGRGVFARKPIKEGAVIEVVPVVLVPFADFDGGDDNPNLAKVFYHWNRTHVAVTLGYGSLYNHSYKPNARYRQQYMSMAYVALRDIAVGEEITVNYNGDPESKAPMGFDVVEHSESMERNGKANKNRLNGAALNPQPPAKTRRSPA